MDEQVRGAEASLLFLPRQLDDFAPAVGLGSEHRTELTGVAGNRNSAEFAEPLPDRGVGEVTGTVLTIDAGNTA